MCFFSRDHSHCGTKYSDGFAFAPSIGTPVPLDTLKGEGSPSFLRALEKYFIFNMK